MDLSKPEEARNSMSYHDFMPYSLWEYKNKYYHQLMHNWYRFMVPADVSILHVNCKSGHILDSFKPKIGVGIDSDQTCIKEARVGVGWKYHSHPGSLDTLNIQYQFDYVLISGATMEVADVQQFFTHLARFCHPRTRIIIDTYSPYLKPLVWLFKRAGWYSPG